MDYNKNLANDLMDLFKLFFKLLAPLNLTNSILTYSFFIVSPIFNCSNFQLMTSCGGVEPEILQVILESWGHLAVINLILRFMAGIGFILDIFALFYLGKILKSRFIQKK